MRNRVFFAWQSRLKCEESPGASAFGRRVLFHQKLPDPDVEGPCQPTSLSIGSLDQVGHGIVPLSA